MIPKIISFVWIGPHALPDWARKNITEFRRLNPDYRIQILGEEVLLPFFQKAYDKIEGEHFWSRRADLVRLSILLRGGGWYFDCDFLPFKPISTLKVKSPKTYITHGSYLANRPWIANGVIGAAADSPFLAAVTTQILMLAESKKPLYWGSYGPVLFTSLSKKFPDLVEIGNIRKFYRVQDNLDAQAIYREIVENQVPASTFFGQTLPFALHMGMQDEIQLRNST